MSWAEALVNIVDAVLGALVFVAFLYFMFKD